LLSFLASLETISNLGKQFVEERGKIDEEGKGHYLMGTSVKVIF